MGLFGKTKSVLVVDTAAVLRTKGVRGRAAPRQNLQILRSLSRLVQRENLKVIAVLAGDPLDKAPHNAIFEGVRVRYANSEAMLDKELIKALKQAGSAGVLITDEVSLETRVLSAGGTLLRVSTFRKLLEDGNEQNENSGGNNNNERDRGPRRERDRGSRRDRDRGPRQNRNNNPQPQQQRPTNEETIERDNNSGNNNNSDDTISQMIDLVD